VRVSRYHASVQEPRSVAHTGRGNARRRLARMEKRYLIGYRVMRSCAQRSLERLVGRLERRWQALTYGSERSHSRFND